MIDSGEKKLYKSLPWDFAGCSNLVSVYMQPFKYVEQFCFLKKKLNSARNLLDDDGIVFLSVKRYIIVTLCLSQRA